jgi:hypothetical protein
MSFLRRLLGADRPAQVELNVSLFKRIRDNATLDVVGEAYSQESFLAARAAEAFEGQPTKCLAL